MGLEEIIEARTARAVEAAIRPLAKEIARLSAAVARLTEAARATNETFDPRERLVTLKDAARRLGVNPARLREMAAEGMISVVATPNGRSKVVESSLNRYIGDLQRKEAG